MASVMRAIAKALATIAGPAGFPAEFAISLYDDEKSEKRTTELMEKIAEGHELTREAIEGIFDSRKEYKELRNQLVLGFHGVLRLLVENQQVLKSLLEERDRGASDNEMADRIAPLVMDRQADLAKQGLITETVIIDELVYLYDEKVGYFLSVVQPAGLPGGVVAINVTPKEVYRSFILTVRGLTDEQNATIFTALFRDRPGSEVFRVRAVFYKAKVDRRLMQGSTEDSALRGNNSE